MKSNSKQEREQHRRHLPDNKNLNNNNKKHESIATEGYCGVAHDSGPEDSGEKTLVEENKTFIYEVSIRRKFKIEGN